MINKIKRKLLGPLSYQAKMLTEISTKINNIEKKMGDDELNIDSKGMFSVVASCYNVENYLENFISSVMVSNKFEFTDIEIILVDDGSTDDTSVICKSFTEKFSNIKYIYKENGGASSGRNEGLKHVTNRWVTFIDPDDRVSENYFYEVYKTIMDTNSLMYCGNLIYYLEDEDEYKDAHPLGYKFRGDSDFNEVNICDNPKFFQLSSSSAFLKMDIIRLWNLQFDESIKLAFEDAIFLTEYLIKANASKIAYIKNAKYYYTKRSSVSSQLQLSRVNNEKYTSFLQTYDDFLTKWSDSRDYSKYLSYMVYYDVAWNIRDMNSFKIKLNAAESMVRETILQSIFSKVGFETISNNWNVLWRAYQIGINYRYFGNKEDVKAGVYYFNQENDYVIFDLLYSDDISKWKINGRMLLDNYEYYIHEDCLNGTYFYSHCYLKIYKKDLENTMFYYDGIVQDKKDMSYYKDEVKKLSKDSVLLFFDRSNMAKDNGEVLYEYFRKNLPEYKNIRFAIKKDSKDWERLKKLGFELIDYESCEFYKYYNEVDFIFSSSFDNEIENPLNLRASGESNSRFIFLQHGIITDDMSERFHFKRFNRFIVSSVFEYENLKRKYTIQNDQILFSSMPRYSLLKNEVSEKKVILYHPTWRSYFRDANSLEINIDKVIESEFFSEITSLLRNKELQVLLKKENIELKFILHPNMNVAKKHFEVYEIDEIKIYSSEEINYTDEFNRCSALITDYSSVFTDVIYLKKPVLFFQFDNDKFFKNHIYEAEMDYKSCGLGDYCSDSGMLLKKLTKVIENEFVISKVTEENIDNFFGDTKKDICQGIIDDLA